MWKKLRPKLYWVSVQKAAQIVMSHNQYSICRNTRYLGEKIKSLYLYVSICQQLSQSNYLTVIRKVIWKAKKDQRLVFTINNNNPPVKTIQVPGWFYFSKFLRLAIGLKKAVKTRILCI